jgi:predicted amidohydrolase
LTLFSVRLDDTRVSPKIRNGSFDPSTWLNLPTEEAASLEQFSWLEQSRRYGDKCVRYAHGKKGVLICADTFLMYRVRIAALKGAQKILVPANWWGNNGQVELWQTRAKEGVWILSG